MVRTLLIQRPPPSPSAALMVRTEAMRPSSHERAKRSDREGVWWFFRSTRTP